MRTIAARERRICDYPDDSCGDNGATGTCKPLPQEDCPSSEGGADLCSCGGTPVASACDAHALGFDLSADASRCEQPEREPLPELGDPCEVGDRCGPGLFCEFDNCGRDGETGTCEKAAVPGQICQQVYACGCNGVRYNTRCDAEAVGISINPALRDNGSECVPNDEPS